MSKAKSPKADKKKPLVWMSTEVKTPPFSSKAKIEAGVLLGRLQDGESIDMPESRAMPSIGARCHELRINDRDVTWRIVYMIDADAVVIGEVFKKKDKKTPTEVIANCKQRFKRYKDTVKDSEKPPSKKKRKKGR